MTPATLYYSASAIIFPNSGSTYVASPIVIITVNENGGDLIVERFLISVNTVRKAVKFIKKTSTAYPQEGSVVDELISDALSTSNFDLLADLTNRHSFITEEVISTVNFTFTLNNESLLATLHYYDELFLDDLQNSTINSDLKGHIEKRKKVRLIRDFPA